MTMANAFVALGWLGTLLYLINHAYISFAQDWRRPVYYGGNLLAALSLVASSFYISSWQAVFINLFWALISLAMVLRAPVSQFSFDKQWFYRAFGLFVLAFVGVSLWQGAVSFAVMGWSSVLVFSVSYLLFSAQRICQREYMLWNAYAAFILLPSLYLDGNVPVVALEIVWGFISLYGALKQEAECHLID